MIGREQYELDAPSDTRVDIEAAAAAIPDAEAEVHAARPADAFGPSAIAHHIARRSFLAGETGHWVDGHRERGAFIGSDVRACDRGTRGASREADRVQVRAAAKIGAFGDVAQLDRASAS